MWMLDFRPIFPWRIALAGTAFVAAGFVYAGGVAMAQDPVRKLLPPLVGNVELPAVTPEQAQQYLSRRKVPRTDPVPLPERSIAAPVKIDVAAQLGHDLPEGDINSYGFKRANFAIADPDKAGKTKKLQESVTGADAAVNRAPTQAIIEETLPEIGEP